MASARVAQQLVMMKDVKVNTNELIMFGHLLRSAAEIAVQLMLLRSGACFPLL